MDGSEPDPFSGPGGLGGLADLAGVADGTTVLRRNSGVQPSIAHIQDALLSLAQREEERTGRPSSMRINLGPGNSHRGTFGPGTERAIIEFQRRVGLPPNGQVDADVLGAMDVSSALWIRRDPDQSPRRDNQRQRSPTRDSQRSSLSKTSWLAASFCRRATADPP